MATKQKLPRLPRAYQPGWLAQVNQRTKPGRMAAATLGALVQDLGGPETISTQKAMLAERASWLHIRLREIEEAYALGEVFNTGEYTMLSNALCAVLGRMGLNRVAKRAPSLAEFIASQPDEADSA